MIKHYIITVAAVGVAYLLGTTFYDKSPFYHPFTKAIAVINPTKGNNCHGVVTFTQKENGVQVTAQVSGLTPGKHGIHIHEFGNCACDDAVCTGEHYNPLNSVHAGPDTKERHLGDMGNITADAQGNSTYSYVDHQLKLNGPFSIIGRAVIIHAQEDDLHTQPSGNSGARIGAGVVGIAKK